MISIFLEIDAVLSNSKTLRDMTISSTVLPLALKTNSGLYSESLFTTQVNY